MLMKKIKEIIYSMIGIFIAFLGTICLIGVLKSESTNTVINFSLIALFFIGCSVFFFKKINFKLASKRNSTNTSTSSNSQPSCYSKLSFSQKKRLYDSIFNINQIYQKISLNKAFRQKIAENIHITDIHNPSEIYSTDDSVFLTICADILHVQKKLGYNFDYENIASYGLLLFIVGNAYTSKNGTAEWDKEIIEDSCDNTENKKHALDIVIAVEQIESTYNKKRISSCVYTMLSSINLKEQFKTALFQYAQTIADFERIYPALEML
jgi:hypothetical protein